MPHRKKKPAHYLFFNRVIWLLTMSDVFTWGFYTVLSSLTGLYLAKQLNQDAVKMVGLGTAIYWISRAGFQIPFGILTDKLKKDLDEIIFLMLGSSFMGVSFLCYPLIGTEYHFYMLQFMFGLGAAMNIIGWRKLFTHNLDRHKEGIEYGIYETIMGISIGLFGIVAGVVANMSHHYFTAIIVLIGWMMILSGGWGAGILLVRKRKKNL